MLSVELYRADSQGIKGTYANIDHHAAELRGLVEYLEARATRLGFRRWRQAHNVHMFVTPDDRTVILRPFRDDGYAGIYAAIKLGRGRSEEHVFSRVYADERDGFTWGDFAKALKVFAKAGGLDA